MAKDNKFGTFAGVYTPSLLTILGVIMYLRLPWVIGQAGLYLGLGIIIVAHVVSFSTGLSISSIATDKNVGAGGPYFIVSRSLGLPIGATLGLALFVGLAFSISLYVIGFSESLLHAFDLEPSPSNIRLTGTVTLFALTIITFISTALALKAQYVIFLLIVLSLGSILLASPSPTVPILTPATADVDPARLFAIFFPAVTGFTAGVNMSGDLRNPRTAIPRGTLLAIGSGMLVYVGLAVFIALRVPRQLLLDDSAVLTTIAKSPTLVTAGVWGATLSSALGSILGAPRILQAMSQDRITAGWFGKGYGPTKEPRNALLVAFLIGWGGILIAELDAIARIVSMVFLATYGFLNLSCAIESWASPDFRPAFRIPKSVSVIGAATCVLVMIQLDLPAMTGAVVLMTGLYVWLARRQIRLESGDTWEGFWASLVRTGLFKLTKQSQQQRNWRPNVLLFRRNADNPALTEFSRSLVSGSGLLSDFLLKHDSKSSEVRPIPAGNASAPQEAPPLGVFRHQVNTKDPADAILAAARFHGFAGLSPNTVLLDWPDFEGKAELLSRLTTELRVLDYNVLLFSSSERSQESVRLAQRIDVWWSPGAGNLALAVALVRFIGGSEQFRHAQVRFILVSEDPTDNAVLRSRTRRILQNARVTAEVEVLNNALDRRRLEDLVQGESGEAALTVLGLVGDAQYATPDYFRALEELRRSLHAVLLIGSSSHFPQLLQAAGKSNSTLAVSSPEADDAAFSHVLKEAPERVALLGRALAEAYGAIVADFHERCTVRIYESRTALLHRLERLIERHFHQLTRACSAENPRRRRKLVARAQSGLAQGAKEELSSLLDSTLTEQEAALDGSIEAFVGDERFLPSKPDAVARFVASKSDFAPQKGDSRALRGYKRRRRILAFFWRSDPSYSVRLRPLEVFYRDRMIRSCLQPLVNTLTADTNQLAAHIGKLLDTTEFGIAALDGRNDAGALAQLVAAEQERALRHVADLCARQDLRQRELLSDAQRAAEKVLSDFLTDVADVGIVLRMARSRRSPKDQASLVANLLEVAPRWRENQTLLFRQSQLVVQLAAFQQRVGALLFREKERLAQQGQQGTRAALSAYQTQLQHLRTLLLEGNASSSTTSAWMTVQGSASGMHLERHSPLEPATAIERLEHETQSAYQPLPDAVELPTAEGAEQLEERGGVATETIALEVRAVCQFLVQSQLLGGLKDAVAEWPRQERRALAVGQDVERLLNFQLNESELSESSWEECRALLLPAVDNGLERIEGELARLDRSRDAALGAFEARLRTLIAQTRIAELMSVADTLDQKRRLERSRRAVTGLRGAWLRASERVRQLATRGLYRISRGLVLARTLAAPEQRREVAGTLRSFVVNHSPAPAVVQQLPFFYRQLFFGQASLADTFWVGRRKELGRAQLATAGFDKTGGGILLVHGDRGAGKTAFCQYFVSHSPDRKHLFQIQAPPGGSVSLAAFKTACEAAFGREGTLDDLFSTLPPGSIVVIDDLELWWQRSPSGFAVLDTLLELSESKETHCLLVLSVGTQALHLLSQVRPLAERALAVLGLPPFDADELRQVIGLRHGSTGVRFELGGKDEKQLSTWALARLYAAHFHYAGGLVGPALSSWVTHIEDATDKLQLRLPRRPELALFDDLDVEQIAIVVQLALHKQLSTERVRELCAAAEHQVEEHLKTLSHVGFVTSPRPDVFELNRFVQHFVTERFRSRGLLP